MISAKLARDFVYETLPYKHTYVDIGVLFRMETNFFERLGDEIKKTSLKKLHDIELSKISIKKEISKFVEKIQSKGITSSCDVEKRIFIRILDELTDQGYKVYVNSSDVISLSWRGYT